MRLSPAEKKVLNAGKQALKDRRNISERERKAGVAFMARRQRAAAGFKRKLFDQALRAAGIDAKELAKRQASDKAAVVQFMEAQKRDALARAAANDKRQRVQAEDRLSRWDRIRIRQHPLPELPFVDIVKSATEIIATEGTTSIAPELNIVKTQAEVSSGGYLGGPLEGNLVCIDWHFLWTPPQEGLLNAVTFLQTNGQSGFFVNPDCNGGSASSSITAGIQLTQLNEQGQPSSDHHELPILDFSVSNNSLDSLGEFSSDSLDDATTLSLIDFPTLSGIPLLITVSANLYVLVQNASSLLDFESDAYRLNVPYVVLILH